MPHRNPAAMHERGMRMHLKDHTVLIINAIVLILIVFLLITLPRDLFEREPPEPPPPPQRASAIASTGAESLLVLLSEYNFDHQPRFTARVAPGLQFCGAIPFIEPSMCTPPVEELSFIFENDTSSGVLGYAVMSDTTTARSLMSRYAALTQGADSTYLSVRQSLSSITDHALISEPDEAIVFYHPTGSRYEHAWIARFDQLLIYGYENTPERTITRKFTHAFNSEARRLVIERYELSHQMLGEGS